MLGDQMNLYIYIYRRALRLIVEHELGVPMLLPWSFLLLLVKKREEQIHMIRAKVDNFSLHVVELFNLYVKLKTRFLMRQVKCHKPRPVHQV